QNVYIPDANFKAYLVGNSEINTNGDTEIQVSEASDFNGNMVCSYLNILDLTGVEAFTALTYLDCEGNQLTSLDVSQNTALNTLFCYSNQLTSLNVTQNMALESLECDNNQLTSLDVTQNTALWWLMCDNNQLISLDLSNNNNLQMFYAMNNQLNCINAKNGNNIIIYDFAVGNNPNLTCIEVDDSEWSTNNWDPILLDPQMYFSEDCNYPENCFDSTLGITELTTSKNLIQILDLMGRETSFKPNTPLIYLYDDGSTEKVFSVEY
ncbi:hypothetical protein N9I21_03325, partial [Crocinitomicaceae bacterium]|nr:hypothetical protein [Crocinitomicaceae bacterium]